MNISHPIIRRLNHLTQSAQRTAEWFRERKDAITGSQSFCAFEDVKKLRVPLYTVQKKDERMNPVEWKEEWVDLTHFLYSNQLRQNYIQSKKQGDNFQESPATRWGNMMEDVSAMIYSQRENVKIHEYGLIINKDIPYFACSPDGIREDGILIEIKNVWGNRLIKWNQLKLDYWFQCQWGMFNINSYLSHEYLIRETHFIETRFSEYNNETEFLEDGMDDFYHADGLEKGLIGEAHTGGSRFDPLMMNSPDSKIKIKYFYPPLSLSTEKKKEWIRERYKKWVSQLHLNPYEVVLNFRYWALNEYNYLRIPIYDEFIMNRMVPCLKETWNMIEELEITRQEEDQIEKDDELPVDISNVNVSGFR